MSRCNVYSPSAVPTSAAIAVRAARSVDITINLALHHLAICSTLANDFTAPCIVSAAAPIYAPRLAAPPSSSMYWPPRWSSRGRLINGACRTSSDDVSDSRRVLAS
ncbi:hypothetical protein HBI22_232300 [Parastagonospora nodorum]|nr:hypothetical protein HBI28_214960 [Parastagonospora nodorum]KAH5618578.1 hypothetical protein HBI22_232300 [Parastagonospora nodorum]